MQKQNQIKNIFILAVIGILAVLSFQVLAPYINIFVIAFIIVEIFYPVYLHLLKLIKNRPAAALISTISSLLLVIIPLIVVVLIIAGEAISFSKQAQDYLVANDLINQLPQDIARSVNGVLTSLNVPEKYLLQINLSQIVNDLAGNVASTAGNLAGQILAGGIGFVFNLFLLFISLFFLFQGRAELPNAINRYSPLDDDMDKLFFNKFTATAQALIKGTFIVALLQATVVLVPLLLIGVSSPLLLWVIMVLASLLPIGSGIVWGPAGVVLIVTGQPLLGILLIVYSAVAINVVDAIVRPIFVRNETNLHPLLTLFSILGGISVFGLIGIIYGPIIIVILLTVLDIYSSRVVEKGAATKK